jgi:hypothetical protein
MVAPLGSVSTPARAPVLADWAAAPMGIAQHTIAIRILAASETRIFKLDIPLLATVPIRAILIGFSSMLLT